MTEVIQEEVDVKNSTILQSVIRAIEKAQTKNQSKEDAEYAFIQMIAMFNQLFSIDKK